MLDLELRGVGREFVRGDRVVALDDVSLRIPAGQFVAITGESGGGKSTLLNVLGMLDTPDRGTYIVGRKEPARLSRSEQVQLRARTFSYVFQAFHLLERRDALASVELPLLYSGVGTAERRTRALEALATVNLERFARTPVHLLSGGQRQRVAIARALAARAPVLLADEPTGSLDSENTRDVIESLKQVHAGGATVVLVTHSAEVAQAAQRRIQIVDGRVFADSLPNASSEYFGPPSPRRRTKPSVFALWRDAIWNAIARPGRTAAMAASLALAIGLLLSTLGLTYAARAQVSELFDLRASLEVTVEWEAQPDQRPVELDRVATLNGVAAAAHIEILRSSHVQLRPSEASYAPLVVNTFGDAVRAARLTVQWTPGFSSIEAGSAIVGTAFASQIQLASVELGPSIVVDGVAHEVAGIIEESPRESEWIGAVVLAPGTHAFADNREVLTERVLVLSEPGAAPQVASEVALAMDPYQPERFRVTHPIDPASVRAEVERSVQSAMVVLTIVAMAAAIATIVLTAVAAANERRSEFALRRALGAQPRDIWLMLTAESTVPAVAGGVGGVLLGMTAILAVTLVQRWTPVFDVQAAGLALLTGLGLALAGAIAGALRALRMAPADALRA